METGKKCPYEIPFDENGNLIPLKKQKVNGQDIPLPDPALEGQPHTVVGGRKSTTTGELYVQTATFKGGDAPKINGHEVPISEVHYTNHQRGDHPNPHQHVFLYDFDEHYWYRSGPETF